MKTNFDEIIDRKKSASSKWNEGLYSTIYKQNGGELLPMWVADMDFKMAPAIEKRLKDLVEYGVLGYCYLQDDYYEAIINWYQRRNNWTIKKEAIVFTPGVVPAINFIITTFTKEKDNVLIFTPVYYPFKEGILAHDRNVVTCSLNKDENNYYTIDFERLEKQIIEEKVKLMIFCSPHNPGGRVWKREEVEKVASLALKHNVLLVSDEIHSDLIFGDTKFTSVGNLSDELINNTIITNSVTKTFNLAGVRVSNIIIHNEEIRNRYKKTLLSFDNGKPTAFAIEAVKAAYLECDEWYDEMISYISENMKYAESFIKEKLPRVKFSIPEGTYLGWVDFSDYELTREEMEVLFEKEIKVGIDYGYWFGIEGEGYVRMNFACARTIVEEALTRIEKVLNEKY